MVCVSYKVSVPGSLMLFGEHAVLHHKHSVVVAVNHYITVSLTPNLDSNVKIFSSIFEDHLVELDNFKITQPYDYVLTAIKQYLPKIKSGFTLNITTDFPADIGFGSSAAVTVAVLGVLHLWLTSSPMDAMMLYRQAVRVVHLVQGFGSGADVAASVFGGVIAYKMRPVSIKRIADVLPLLVVYSGSKMATVSVVALVVKIAKKFRNIFAGLYEGMGSCAKEAIHAIKKNELPRLGKLMNIHQGLQDALGVNQINLSELIFSLRDCPGVYGAKISGSGLGDCVVGIGKLKKNFFPQNICQKKAGVRQIEVIVSKVGITYG